MYIWGLVLFGLGIVAFLDSMFNLGQLYRITNSIIFMLISLNIIIKTRMMEKIGFKERLAEHNEELKARVTEMKKSHNTGEKVEHIEAILH